MNPFLAFASLPADVEHAIARISIGGLINLVQGMAHCILSCPIVNRVSYIPVVFVRARNTSASVGIYSGDAILRTSSKKLMVVSPLQMTER